MLRSRTNRGTVNANHERSMIGPNPRILVVDDETPQVQALCRVLPDHGYAPIGFTSGETALADCAAANAISLLTDFIVKARGSAYPLLRVSLCHFSPTTW